MDDYRSLFHRSPMAIFVEDYSGVVTWFESLRDEGVSDLRSYLEKVPSAIEMARSKIVVNEINDTAVDMFGDVVRQSLVSGVQLDSDGARDGFVEQIIALWEGRPRVDIEFPSLFGQAGPIDCLLSWSVAEHPDGRLDPSRVVVTIADISEQKAADRQVEQKAAQLELLHDVAHDISAQRSIDDVLRRIVEGARHVLGASQARLLLFDGGRSELLAEVDAVPEPDRTPTTVELVRSGIAGWVLERGEPTLSTNIELDSRNRGPALEEARRSEMSALAMTPLWVDGAVVGALAVLRPTAAPAFRVDDLHVLTTLATHAGYAIHGARLLDRLEGAVAARDRLLAMVSHELRTPLTAILGMAGTMRDNAHRMSGDELSNYASIIVEQGKDLAGLVDDLLSSAAEDAGSIDIKTGPVDLWQQVASVAASLGVPASSRGESVEVAADALRVRQVVRNLISNARRHGGPTVRVTVSSDEGTGFVEVSDDGDGVAADLQPRLFEPFEHGDAHPESVGLGLAVSRDLAERMGGSLAYERLDGWSTFRLVLPRVPQAA